MAKKQNAKVDVSDIVNLWNYYFGEGVNKYASSSASRIKVAIAMTESRVLLRYPDSDALIAQAIGDIGGYVFGATTGLFETFGDGAKRMIIETNNGLNLCAIPFRTTEEEDIVVVLYGDHLSIMALQFEDLTKNTWDYVESRLPKK
jgi:hypothetical protein